MAEMDVAKYIESMKGKSMVSLNGFLYRRQRVAQGKSYWVCSLDQRRGCKARLHVMENTDPPVILAKVEEHNHLADFGQAEARMVVKKMKKVALETNRDFSEIFDSVLSEENISAEGLTSLGEKNHVILSLKNVRQKRSGMYVSGDPEINIKFVKLVENYSAIYDYDAQKYLSDNEISEVWKSIAQEMGDTVTSCKEKWRNIKTSYSRLLKGNVRPKESWHYLTKHLGFLASYIRRYPKIGDTNSLVLNVSETSLDNSDIVADQQPENHASPSTFSDDKITPISGAYPDINSPNFLSQTSGFESRNSYSFADDIPSTLPGNSQATDPEVNDHVTNYIDAISKKRKREEEVEDADVGFLKSLMPDLRKMTDAQRHKFKMGVLSLVNDALYSK